MEEDLICPYCGAVQESHEPDEVSSLMCSTECEVCGRAFSYCVTVSRSYDSYEEDDDFDDDEIVLAEEDEDEEL